MYRIVILLLLFCSGVSNASTLIYFPGKNSSRHATALAACKSYSSAYIIRSNNPDGSVYCGSNTQTFWTIRPSSESCPFGDNGTTCNASCLPPKQMVDGQCVNAPNTCLTKAAQSDNFVAANVGFAMCYGGCSMAMDSVQDFRRTADGPVLYHYTGSYTGESCTESVTPVDTSPPEPTESDTTQDCGPSNTATDAEGRQITSSGCTTTDTMIKNQECAAKGGSVGEYNNMLHCVQAGKSPVGGKKTTQVDTVTTKNPDGSTSTKTTTTTTTKTCKGTKPCTTTTTTTSTSTSTNADGTPAGSTSNCKGDNCGTGGKEGSGGGSGSGSGNSDDGEDDDDQEPIPGPDGSLAKGEQGNFAEGIAEWDERIRDISQELDQQLGQYSNLFSGVFDLNLGTGSGSLPCEQIPISFGRFGSTTLDMCLNNYADILAYLRFALMLGAAVLAAFIVMKG